MNNRNENKKTAQVSGFARSFLSSYPIADADITILENNEKLKTNSKGEFGPISWPVGQSITLRLEKKGSWWSGYMTTQTATLIVPPEGINNIDPLKNISFQVPSNFAIKTLSWAMGVTQIHDRAHVAATITPPNTTMDDIPQGVADVEVTLSPYFDLKPETEIKPFYFGMFPIVHKTNPFVRSLKATSEDGGVIFVNIPEGIYKLKAKQGNIESNEIIVHACNNVLVNVSPPQGPVIISEVKSERSEKTGYFQFFKQASVKVSEDHIKHSAPTKQL